MKTGRIIWAMALWLCTATIAWANSAQPGFWDAGGTGTFSLLYPEDSAAYKKVQMVRELVAIQLYPGYAVVKGSYWMYNTSADSLSFKAGYPLFGNYESETRGAHLMQIGFDSLHSMRVKLDGQEVLIFEREKLANAESWDRSRWHTFQTHFAPLDTVLIEVYFILNTNNTIVSQGYSRGYNNGFIYLLETGATWKQPIIQGEVRLQMMGGLEGDDIVGIAPDSIFGLDASRQTWVYRFENLSPTHANNIVLAYGERLEEFDFAQVITQEDKLYQAIEQLSTQPISAQLEKAAFDDAFEVQGINWGMGLLMLLIVVLPILAIVGICVGIVWLFWRYFKVPRKK